MPHGLKNSPHLFSLKVKLTVLAAGSCTQSERITIRGGAKRTIRIPALLSCIEHPRLGPILFDTGYSERFFTATRRFPYILYRWATPVRVSEQEKAVYQLDEAGIKASDIAFVILSHFHADHIGGVQDFPNANFIYLQDAYDRVKRRRGFSAIRAGFLPDLLPQDFEKRSNPINEQQLVSLPSSYPFERGLDLFGDGSVVAVDLPGHAAGQIGVLLDTEEGPCFLCADSVWSSRAYREALPPHWIAGLIMDNRRQYKDSFQRIHQFHKQHPEFRIIPSHCNAILTSSGGMSF